MTNREQNSSDLARNESGAIMVMGIFMAMLMVGFVYYVAGIGETLFFRERMQDASDAGAWAAAVIHARGMNIIALINMIMAAIAAVLIALKIILLMCQIASIICKILCAIPYTAAIGCPLEEVVSALKDAVKEVHDEVQDIADEILPLLTKAERAIAKAIPPIAEVKVIWMSEDTYHDPVSIGFMYSKTLTDVSLPVEDDECSRIEEEGKDYLGDLIGGHTGAMAGIMDKVMGALGDVAMLANGKVCGDSGDSGGTSIDMSQVMDDNANGECDEEDEDDEPEWCQTAEDSTSGTITPEASGNSGDETHPQKVKEDCYLGDKCFNLRVFMIAQGGKLDPAIHNVQTGNWNVEVNQGGGMSALQMLTRVSVAQSEFYYDEAAADTLRDDWMWHMQWRARIRRFTLGNMSMLNNACQGDACGSMSSITDVLKNVMVH